MFPRLSRFAPLLPAVFATAWIGIACAQDDPRRDGDGRRLVFVVGTAEEKLRAFDADTGAALWSAKSPFAGTAAPAVYEVNGRQFVVIAATGGGRAGGLSGAGDAYVAFALP